MSDPTIEPGYGTPVPPGHNPAYGVGYNSPDSYTGLPLQPVAPTPSLNERVVRGILLALLVIPVGVIAWVLLFNAGFIASIVSFGVAFGATWLYRIGSRARVTRGAMWAIIGIIVVTLVISFLAGIYSAFLKGTGLPFGDAVANPKLWAAYWNLIFGSSELWSELAPQVAMAVLFAALGCVRTIIGLARESKS